MSCATSTIKLVIFTFNFFLVCIGFGMVLFGVMDASGAGDYSHLQDLVHDVSLFTKVLIIAGTVVFFVAFFGCWGTVTESPCMLMMYAIFLIALLLLEATAIVYSYIHRESVQKDVIKTFENMMVEYKRSNATAEALDKIQSKIQCCGSNSQNDWWKLQTGYVTPGLPKSCCSNGHDLASTQTASPVEGSVPSCTSNLAYKSGCVSKGMEWLKEKLQKYVWIVGAVFLCEVITIFFVIMVHNGIKNEMRRGGYA